MVPLKNLMVLDCKAMVHMIFAGGFKGGNFEKDLKDFDFIREFSCRIQNGLHSDRIVIHVEEK